MIKSLVAAAACLLLVSGCSTKAKTERHTQRGDTFYEKKDWERAKLEYLNAYRSGSREPEVLARLADCFLQTGEPGGAVSMYREVRELQPTNTVVRGKLATLLFAGGYRSNAVEEAEAILKIAPDHGEALALLADSVTNKQQAAVYQPRLEKLQQAYPANAAIPFALGVLAHKSGDLETARGYYEKSLSLDPAQSKVHLAMASLATTQKDLKLADAQYQAAAALAPAKSWERLRQLEHLLKTQRFAEAEKNAQEILAEEPEFIPALNYLTQALLAQNKVDEADAQNKKALGLAPASRDARLHQSRILLARRDAPGAIEVLQEAAKSGRPDVQLQYQLALAHVANRDAAKALAAVDTAVALDPKHLQSVLLRSELQLRTRNQDAAIAELNRIAEVYPAVPQVRFILALAHRSKRDFQRAAEIYNGLATELPSDPRPPYLAGLCYRDLQQRAQARAAYEEALRRNRGFLSALEELINLEIAEKKTDAALTQIDSYLKDHPEQPVLLLLKAKVLTAAKKVDEAEAVVQKALEIDPDFHAGQRALVALYLSAGKQNEAIQRLDAMVKTNPKDFQSRSLLAMLHETKKDYANARAHYDAIIKADTGVSKMARTIALNNLATIQMDHTGEPQAALENARKARELMPAEALVGDTYGWALWKNGEYERALTELEVSTAQISENPEAQFHLGMAHYMMGNQDEARKALEFSAGSDTDFRGKEQAQAALAILNTDPAAAPPATLESLQNTVKQSPNDLMAQVRIAQILAHQKNWPAAEKAYQAALKVNPRSQEILTQLAELNSYGRGDHVRALELARQTWAISPNGELASRLGKIAFRSGDYKWAAAVLSDARRTVPNDGETGLYLSLAWYALGDSVQARNVLRETVSNVRELPAIARLTLPLLEYQVNAANAAEAGTAAAAALGLDSGYVPALLVQGMLAEAAKDFAAARQKYQSALKEAPKHVSAQRQLGLFLSEQATGEQQATQLLTAAKSALPNDAEITKALGKIAYRGGEYREAARLLKDASFSLPQDAELLYYLGLSQHRLNERQAQDSLTRALQLDAKSDLAADAKKALTEMQ